jgi:hypothetical protein
MQMNEASAPYEKGRLPLMAAADLQDHLMTATNDLDRLQTLLSDACTALFTGFHGASEQMHAVHASGTGNVAAAERAIQYLGTAVIALQFQDMASQLIAHTHKRLRNCADTLAREAFGDDEEGATFIDETPMRPNPVTQDEMDAGSIELF